MSLEVISKEKEPGIFVYSLIGSLDTDTYQILEKKIDLIIESQPKVIVFNMKHLEYISSMGIRVIIGTTKSVKDHGGKVAIINLQPQIEKVFEIIKALPSQKIFKNNDELDSYLDGIQRKMKEH